MNREAFRDDLAAYCGATASAFVPHEPDGVSFVQDSFGARYRRTCEAGIVRYYAVSAEPAAERLSPDFAACFSGWVAKAHAAASAILTGSGRELDDVALMHSAMPKRIEGEPDASFRERLAAQWPARRDAVGGERHTISQSARRSGKSWFNQLWLDELAEQRELRTRGYSLKVETASPEDRAARKSGKVTLTYAAQAFDAASHFRETAARARYEELTKLPAAPDEIELPDWLKLKVGEDGVEGLTPNADCSVTITGSFKLDADGNPIRPMPAAGPDRYLARFTGSVRVSDEPGIAAMAAKNVKPAAEPIVRVAGIESTAREIAEALLLLRAKNAPPAEKQAPIGLMFRDDSFDHRLGAWKV